jgi:hypothetical protein
MRCNVIEQMQTENPPRGGLSLPVQNEQFCSDIAARSGLCSKINALAGVVQISLTI